MTRELAWPGSLPADISVIKGIQLPVVLTQFLPARLAS